MTALNLTGYHLTFDDEFNSFLPTELGGPTWSVTIFDGNETWGSQNYTDGPDGGLTAYLANGGTDPFSDANGVLSITATPNVPGTPSDYTTGLIDNRGTFNQTYGYFEMRAELPAGAGLWPGFWTLPTVDNNGGVPEIDAMEAFGAQYGWYGGSNQVHYNVHSDTSPNETGTWASVNADIYTSYNTYGVMWTPTTLTFYFDGQSIGSLPTPADLVGNSGEYLLASLLTGSPTDWPGPMDGESGTLKIDYIRAFSSDSAIPAVALQAISSPDGGGTSLYGATATANSGSSSTTTTTTTPPATTTSSTGSTGTKTRGGRIGSSRHTTTKSSTQQGTTSAATGARTNSSVQAAAVPVTNAVDATVVSSAIMPPASSFIASSETTSSTTQTASSKPDFLAGAKVTLDDFNGSGSSALNRPLIGHIPSVSDYTNMDAGPFASPTWLSTAETPKAADHTHLISHLS
jgi:beta-glucanase (GH16 family)